MTAPKRRHRFIQGFVAGLVEYLPAVIIGVAAAMLGFGIRGSLFGIACYLVGTWYPGICRWWSNRPQQREQRRKQEAARAALAEMRRARDAGELSEDAEVIVARMERLTDREGEQP